MTKGFFPLLTTSHSLKISRDFMSSCTPTVPGENADHTAELQPVREDNQPPIHNRNGVDGVSISWREIYETTALWPPTLGLDFVRAAQHTTTTTYELGEACGGEGPGNCSRRNKEQAMLILAQGLGNLGLGAVVWDCGEILAAFLGRRRHLVQGKRVLDLGTGTGIAGLAAAQCGAGEVVLTDHPNLGPLVRSNVERNTGFTRCCVSFAPFNWDDTEREAKKLASPSNPFDVVLASDCLYDPTVFPAFRQALAAMCGPRTVVIMAYKRRLDSREQDFFAELEHDFILALVGTRRNCRSIDSDDTTGTSATEATTIDGGVYLLLGARRGCAHGESLPPSLEEWDTVLNSVNSVSRPK